MTRENGDTVAFPEISLQRNEKSKNEKNNITVDVNAGLFIP